MKHLQTIYDLPKFAFLPEVDSIDRERIWVGY